MDHRLWDVPRTSRYYLPLKHLLSRLDKSDASVTGVDFWELRSGTYIWLAFRVPHKDLRLTVGIVPDALMKKTTNLLATDVYKNVRRQRGIQEKFVGKMREGLKSYGSA